MLSRCAHWQAAARTSVKDVLGSTAATPRVSVRRKTTAGNGDSSPSQRKQRVIVCSYNRKPCDRQVVLIQPPLSWLFLPAEADTCPLIEERRRRKPKAVVLRRASESAVSPTYTEGRRPL